MHHVSGAEAFESISTIIFTELTEMLQSDDFDTRTERVMELAIVLTEVRKGSRVHGTVHLRVDSG